MMKMIFIGLLILLGALYVFGFFSEYSLRQTSLEEYTRSFVAQCERYVTEQFDEARRAIDSASHSVRR